MSDREFDIVVFGATGFVGSLTAAHLARAAGPSVRIALAGRSSERLQRVRDALGDSARTWDVVEVDAHDAAGLRAMASRTTVIATAVGPYARDGKEVVRAAAESGTHYADLTGELLFVRWSLDHIDAAARGTAAKIVHSCGFDSIPSDLGVLVTAERAATDGEGTLGETTLVVRSLRGGISGGTVDSARQQAIAVQDDPRLRTVLRNPDALRPQPTDEGVPASLLPRQRPSPVEREPRTGRWLGPFVMADYNERLVGLSHALSGGSYGPGFRYREASDLGRGPLGPFRAWGLWAGLGALSAGLSWAPSRRVLDALLPKPGEGPSAGRRARGRFRLEITSTTTTGARYRTTVAADHDPGYDGTSIMLGQSALCLALDGTLPHRSGVLTPATALGVALVDRLRTQGFTIEVDRVG